MSAALVLFPGALGDALCCWPAIDALVAAGHAVTLASRVDLTGLLPSNDLRLDRLERREITDLFATPTIAEDTRRYLAAFARIDSFTGAADAAFATRLAAAAGCPTAVHAFRGMRTRESAVAYYARCLRVIPRVRLLPIAEDAAAWAESLWRSHRLGHVLALHPGSGSAAKNWHGMAALANAWRRDHGHILTLLGPAEVDRGVTVPADVTLINESLPRIAAVLHRASRYVGNDSGVSHLAGQVGAETVVLFADSDATVWAPSGPRVTVLQANPACARCGPGEFCIHRLSVATVLSALL